MVGDGVYPLSEAARYAGVSPSTVRSWFKPRSDGAGNEPVFQSDYEVIDGDYAIRFLNLIEIYVSRFFKNELVNTTVIRRAHQILQNELHTPHPFAHEQLGTAGKRILRKQADSSLVDVISKQHFFGQMLLDTIKYSPATQLAVAWNIAPGISISAGISYGKPVVKQTGVTTFVVANQFRANGRSAPIVAKLFDLSESDVLNAVRFEDGLKKRAA